MKYNKKMSLFLILPIIFIACSSESHSEEIQEATIIKTITELEQIEDQINDLESKEELTPQEQKELVVLEEELESVEVFDEAYLKTLERKQEIVQGLSGEIYSDFLNQDPKVNLGVYLRRHCEFTGMYKGIFYEQFPLLDLQLDDSAIKEHYSVGDFYDGKLSCTSGWEIEVGIVGDSIIPSDVQIPEEEKRRDLYGLSFYDRILPFYDERPEGQQGLWGQWIQARNSHPHGPGGGTIEGGLFIGDKMGRSKFPKYMANGAALFYNPSSSLSGWGFYEKRVDCDCYGGIQITNKVLNSPNLISFADGQKIYDEDGGIYFGHGWMALPLIGGDYRKLIEEPSDNIGKLTWTFFMNSAQYSGPTWGYVPEFWYRRIDRWNSLEYIIDSDDKSKQVYKNYITGKISNEELNNYVKSQSWYVDNADEYDYEKGGPFWMEEKNTLAYTSTEYAAIGAEMGPLQAFTEYDQNGDLYLKIFPPEIPSNSAKEYFILDARFYDVDLYNSFLDLLNADDTAGFTNTNFKRSSEPLVIEKYPRERSSLDNNQIYMIDIPEEDLEFQTKKVLSWNMRLEAELNSNNEVSNYWSWGNLEPEQREINQYYKVIEGAEPKDYQFIPILEQDVPQSLKKLTFSNQDRVKSFMPHIKTEADLAKEQHVKSNDIRFFGDMNSDPINYTCWECDEDMGCDTTIYKSELDDGSEIYYRWYKFRDQPTFQQLKIDYPGIYTEDYLDNLQITIERMHSQWSQKQIFIPVPKTLDSLHLVELDHGLVVSTPTGLEVGWVPIVLEVKSPYGVYATEISFLELDGAGEISDW